MTIDEVIKEFVEWAKSDRDEVNYWLSQRNESDETNPFRVEYGGFAKNAEASAERYEQLAAWLRELKELRNSVRGVNLTVADVQPLSVVAEHIKERLYETALNTSEAVARDAIADMAERIDFWIDELKDGE